MAVVPKWDAIVMGGGAIGMAVAYELALADWKVAIVDRDRPGRQGSQQASWAAAGMLAPAAEHLPNGPLLDLCRQSLTLYPAWSAQLERIAGVDTGYWPCGILMPHEDGVLPVLNPEDNHPQLDRPRLDALQPGLGDCITGATWLPEEGQVDNRQLITALRAALPEVGVTLVARTEVTGWVMEGDRVIGIATERGQLFADTFVAAAGSHTGQSLDIPVRPVKGQMLALHDPQQQLQRVLYGDGIYIVPRRNGRIVVGATVEDIGFVEGNTGAGIQTLLNRAIRLYPRLATLTLQETWWGFRPATPDLSPILGHSAYANLYFATGHHRNGILLTPITAKVISQLMRRDRGEMLTAPAGADRTSADPLDLTPFRWQRFTAVSAAGLC